MQRHGSYKYRPQSNFQDKKTPDGINCRKKDQHTEAMKIETNKNEIHRTKEIKQKVKKKKSVLVSCGTILSRLIYIYLKSQKGR